MTDQEWMEFCRDHPGCDLSDPLIRQMASLAKTVADSMLGSDYEPGIDTSGVLELVECLAYDRDASDALQQLMKIMFGQLRQG